jgi:hypothetical protein
VDKRIKEDRDQKIFDMFMAGYTQEDIAPVVNMDQSTITRDLKVLGNLENLPKFIKLFTSKQFASFEDPDFHPPLYDLWSYGKLTNETLCLILWISRVDGMNICGWMDLDHLLNGNSEDGWKYFDWLWCGMPEYPLLDWFCMKDGVWKWMECMEIGTLKCRIIR